MSYRICAIAGIAAAVTLLGNPAAALNLLSPGDFIIGIDQDQSFSHSSPAGGEPPSNAIDGTLDKYLNFSKENSGLILIPSAMSVVQSMVITTAGDAVERDPASYVLMGTNDPVISINNSRGVVDNWQPIASGPLALPGTRDTVGDPVDIINATSYSAYRLVFPTLKNSGGANSMQIAEVQFYTEPSGGGSAILAPGDTALAIDIDPRNIAPDAEGPTNLLDGDTTTKFLSFGKELTGVIVTPGVGASVLEEFTMNLAGDSEGFSGRDPFAYEVYGTNDDITSVENGTGLGEEDWSLIASDSMTYDPADEGFVGPFHVGATESYSSYKILFTSLRDTNSANSVQISELQLIGRVPEPSSVALLVGGLLGLAFNSRKALRRSSQRQG